MGRIPGVLWSYVKRALRPLWQWWTIENSRSAADLLVKLAAPIGVLVAASFFLMKPDIDSSEEYHCQISRACVHELYGAPSEVPPLVDRVVTRYKRVGISSSSQLAIAFLAGSALSRADLVSLATPTPMDIPDDIRELLESRYAGSLPPEYALELATSGQFTLDEIEFALEAIEQCQYYEARVRVSNRGEAIARQVTVSPPEGFSRSDGELVPFDLPSYQSENVVFRSSPSESGFVGDICVVPQELLSESFKVSWQSSDVLDVRTIRILVAVLVGLWLLTIIKEVYFIHPSNEE